MPISISRARGAPTLYALKPRFQRLLDPVIRILMRAGVSANQVTVAAFVLSLATGGAILIWPHESWPLLVVPAVLFVRMALNAIDGPLARRQAPGNSLGVLLNELDVVLSDTAIYLPLALVPGIPASLMVLAVVLAMTAEFAGVVALQVGGERRLDGPMGKADRALAIGTITLLLGLGVEAGLWVNIALGIITLLLAVTILNRCRNSFGR